MKLSHSKLNCILDNPMEYYLNYKQGISLKDGKKALTIGSAMHWMIEHNCEDSEGYCQEEGDRNHQSDYSKEMVLAEAMAHGYFYHKDKIYEEILADPEGGEPLQIVEEYHELEITAPLKSYKYADPHQFLGILDLLLLTNKGFVLVDYKTSSQKPHWEDYLQQIYRYIFLLNSMFPEVPVVKIGIVNVRKSGIKIKANENLESYKRRLFNEYELNDNDLINTHMYNSNELDANHIKEYVSQLSGMADMAQMIDENAMFYINYKNADGIYGHSTYWDIYYHTKDAYILYKIKDTIYDELSNTITDTRDCVPLDMLAIEKPDKIMNKYSVFKKNADTIFGEAPKDKNKLFEEIKNNYETDDELLEKYWVTLEKEENANS